MVVDLYAIDHGYGFCTLDGQRVFFRIEDFYRCDSKGPLPICGERVSADHLVAGGKSPQALGLRRLTRPELLRGLVKSFDSNKGWGFITSGGQVYFLHRSDLTTSFVPLIGSHVLFYSGVRRGRPRAFYITPDTGSIGERRT